MRMGDISNWKNSGGRRRSRTGTVPLDWKAIAQVDLNELEDSSIEMESVYGSLQEVLMCVAFCAATDEFGQVQVDQSLMKVFRLAQLIIRYLLHSQDKLTQALEAVQRNNDSLKKEYSRLEKRLSRRELQLRDLSHECRKRKKMIEVQQSCIYEGKDPALFQKCHLCPKTFVNTTFLTAHIARRHNQQQQHYSDTIKKNKKKNGLGDEEEKEDRGEVSIKEELEIAERRKNGMKQEEPQRRLSLPTTSEAASFSKLAEELRAEIRDILKKEENVRKTSEVEMVNSSEEIKSMVEKQAEEIDQLRRKLKQEHEEKMERVVEKKKEEDDSSRLASQERFWQAKMREIMEGHRNEMDDIKTELEAMKKEQEKVSKKFATEQEGKNHKEFLDHRITEKDFPNDRPETTPKGLLLHQLQPPIRSRSYENVVLTPSNLANHEYVSMRSLFSPSSVENLMEENPSFLHRFRHSARCDLDDRIDFLLNGEEAENGFPLNRSRITDKEYEKAIDRLKEQRRKNVKNIKAFSSLRRKCKSEVEQLTSQADVSLLPAARNSSLKMTPSFEMNFGQRMNSMRNRLMRGWRKQKKEDENGVKVVVNNDNNKNGNEYVEFEAKRVKGQAPFPPSPHASKEVKEMEGFPDDLSVEELSSEKEMGNSREKNAFIPIPAPRRRKSVGLPQTGSPRRASSPPPPPPPPLPKRAFENEQPKDEPNGDGKNPYENVYVQDSEISSSSEEDEDEEISTQLRNVDEVQVLATEDEMSSKWDSSSNNRDNQNNRIKESEEEESDSNNYSYNLNNNPIDASKIKLKKPVPGSKIDSLKNTIEVQLRSRGSKTPPAGGINVMSDGDDWSIRDLEEELAEYDNSHDLVRPKTSIGKR